MKTHFDQELENLQGKVLRLGGMAERMIERAVASLVQRDSGLARATIEEDHQINALEVEIDEDCHRILALYQPKAGDLRFVTTALKIITELERLGDQAVNICERALELNEEPQLKPYIDIPRMAEIAQRMVKESLEAYVRRNVQLALKVKADDDEVDNLNDQVFRELLTFMISDPKTITRAARLIFVGRYLERIADHATNIGELVVYMVQGKVIRHMV